MTSFSVRPRHLTHNLTPRCTQLVGFYVGAAGYGGRYMVDELPTYEGAPIYNWVKDQATATYEDNVRPYLNAFEGFYRYSSQELLETAQYYMDNEQAALEAADREFAAALDAPAQSTGDTSRAAPGPDLPPPPIHDPANHAGTPRGTIQSDLVSIASGALGTFTSPSSIVNELFRSFFGFSPFDWVLDRIGRDWRPLSNAGAALENVGEMVMEINMNQGDLAYFIGNPDDGWSGKAADHAHGIFLDAWKSAQGDAQTLRGAGQQLDGLACIGHELGELVIQRAQLCLDRLLTMVLPGAPAWLLLGAMRELKSLADDVSSMISGTIIALKLSSGSDLSTLGEPPAQYDNPLVG